MNQDDEKILRVLLAGADTHLVRELKEATGKIRGLWIRLEQCESCDSALEQLDNGAYNLCLAAEPLQGASVAEFIRRALARDCPVPIVAVGSDNAPDAAAEAMKAGATDYLGREEITASLLERIFKYAVESRRLEEEIATLLSAAGESARAKAQFIATISHEFKTPLSAVIGMIDLVLDSGLTEKQHDDLMLARASADSLLGLMNNIIDYSALQSGKLSVQNRFFRLRQLLAQVLSPLHGAAAQKSLRLASRVAPEVPEQLFSDPVRLSQVISHLVGNAVKFTDEGKVTVSVDVQELAGKEPVLRWLVADTGPGIPAAGIDSVFHHFTQVDGSSTRRHGGVGLGLSMVRHLVSLLGGKIWVESEPGKGASFHFTTRFTPAHADCKPGQTGEGAVHDPPAGSILAADDSQVNRMLLTEILRKAGFRVTLVDNGIKAVEATEKEHFTAVLMDLQMPEMDGYAATRAIRAREAATGGHLPIFALTGSNNEHDLELCRQAEMDGYLKKPLREHELLALLQEFAGRPAPAGKAEAFAAADEDSSSPFSGLYATFGGDTKAIEELIGYFLLESTAQLHNIKCGLAAGDETLVEQSAHKLKGMAANVGAVNLADEAFRIQLAVRKRDFDSPKGIVQRLEEMLAAIESRPR